MHLAQVNIALPREPLDAPLLRDFVAALDPVNAIADAAPASSGACRPRTATRPASAGSATTA